MHFLMNTQQALHHRIQRSSYQYHLGYLVMAFTLLIMSSCAHRQNDKVVISQDWAKHQEQLLALAQWEALGKLGAKVPNDSMTATIHWLHTPSRYDINLSGPLGQGHMSIHGDKQQVTFSDGQAQPQIAKTAEELIRKNTRWNIPVTQLAYWVRGLPAPNTPITRFAANNLGLIGELDQMGWKLVYGDYINIPLQTGSTIAMPNKITAEFKELRLTLIIREWRMGEPQ